MASAKTIILITGANGGIGFEAAKAIVEASPNYHVLLCSRSLEKGQKALSELQGQNPLGTSSLLQLDITDGASIAAAASKVGEEFGHIDVLINNAGITDFSPDLLTQLRRTFETNTFGPAVVTEAFAPLLLKSTSPLGPRLIHVSSGLGSINIRSDESDKYYKLPATTYRMSKAAMNMLAMCHYAEFRERGLKVWAFDPGYTVTNLTGEADKANRVKAGAGSPRDCAEAMKKIVEGGRDEDVGKFVHADGVYPW